ncbi:CAP domain-containing protein [Streptomyces sp. ISL-12]|uniref:CAP domain-containing protein n=1 Tax=Streptomyces sp. ISL-12 TaxID=2819177 RepID=UPI001BE8D4D5|nr:CAP domain-containing protein [Streptomyces sp. ISL-12]MBT2413291.1 CAP domain-containing protein [Streptomyces sp. ISL-12]
MSMYAPDADDWDSQWDGGEGRIRFLGGPAARDQDSPPRPRRTADASTVGGGAVRRLLEDPVSVLVNRERVARGLEVLVGDERLRTSARGHSAEMVRLGFFDHMAPDGTSPAERMLAAGFPLPGGENIAFGQPTPEAVVADWMNSPPHRRNILRREFRVIGVGVCVTSLGPMWTQNFGYV